MKVRLDFVTNSSSSSFIIAVKKDICPHCGRVNPILYVIERLTEGDGFDDNISTIDIKGKTEIINNIKENKFDYTSDDLSEIIEKIEKFSEKDYSFYKLSVSYHDDILNTLMKSKDIIVLVDGG